MALLLVLAVGSCSDAGDDAGGSATSSGDAAEAASPESPDPSETWSVAAADGPRLELDHVKLRVPGSYDTDGPSKTGTFHSASERGLGGYVAAHEKPAINADLTLRQRAESSARSSSFVANTPPRLAGFIDVAGERMYHLTGPADENDYYDQFGAVVDGLHIYVSFTQPKDYPPKKRERVIESVLASLTWK